MKRPGPLPAYGQPGPLDARTLFVIGSVFVMALQAIVLRRKLLRPTSFRHIRLLLSRH